MANLIESLKHRLTMAKIDPPKKKKAKKKQNPRPRKRKSSSTKTKAKSKGKAKKKKKRRTTTKTTTVRETIETPARPPKGWWDAATRAIRQSGSAADPAAVAGATWARMTPSQKRIAKLTHPD